MSRCVHLHDSGSQCVSEAIAGTDFCEDHGGTYVLFDRLPDHPFQKLVTRIVALVLLMILLIPFYYTLKTLYLDAAVEVGETP